MLIYLPIFFLPSTPLQYKLTFWLIVTIAFILSVILLGITSAVVRASNQGVFTAHPENYTGLMDRSVKELIAAAAFTVCGLISLMVIVPIFPAATWLSIVLLVFAITAFALNVGGASGFIINGRHITKTCTPEVAKCKLLAGSPIVAYILLFPIALLWLYAMFRIFKGVGVTSTTGEENEKKAKKAEKATKA